MFNFQPFLSKISGGIDTAAEWFYRFKKTKGFRLTALSLALLLAALYIFGIYCNQKRLEKFAPKKIVYHMGDRIAFGENFMGMYTTANGYYVTFTEAYATSFDDFVKGNQLDASQIISWLTEDQGISGTSMAKRDEFNRMIADCQRGKIDRIITKSVSRFARNTVDCLDTVRKLSAIGISVLFQKEQIDTAEMSSEFLLALAGVQAQDESVSISQNVKWGCKTRMKHGELVGSAAYGYVMKNGTLVINEEEAEVIRTIFRLYLSGMGKPKIADYLNENNIPYHGSVENWSLNTIDYILQNERYIGDALLQKTFTSDRLPFKRHRNKGNCPMYYVSFSHPPIISREDFEAVRELQKKRNTTITRTHRKLSKLLVCNDCNHSYRRIEINAKNYWKCPCRSRGERNCDSILLYEEDVCAALIRMVNILHQNYNYIIKPAIAAKEHLISKENGVDHKVYEIDKLIAEVNNQIHLLTQLQVQGILDPTDFTLESSTLTNKVNKLRAERMRLLRQSQLNDELIKMEETADIIYSIDQELATFDEELIRNIVEKVIVKSSVEIEIHLFGGLVITEYLPKRKERNHQE